MAPSAGMRSFGMRTVGPEIDSAASGRPCSSWMAAATQRNPRRVPRRRSHSRAPAGGQFAQQVFRIGDRLAGQPSARPGAVPPAPPRPQAPETRPAAPCRRRSSAAARGSGLRQRPHHLTAFDLSQEHGLTPVFRRQIDGFPGLFHQPPHDRPRQRRISVAAQKSAADAERLHPNEPAPAILVVNNVMPLLQTLQQPVHGAGRQPGHLPQLAQAKAGLRRCDAFSRSSARLSA